MDNEHEPSGAEKIGATLKSARAARGDSLEAVCRQTRISKRFIEAMENGHPEELPAPVYWRGFLKSYCDYLELEFEPLWDSLKPPEPPQAAAPAEKKEEETPQSLPVTPYLAALSSSWIGVFLSVALAVGMIVFAVKTHRASSAAEDAPLPSALLPLHRPQEAKLTVIFRDDSWLSLKADGHLLFEGRVPKNSRQQWNAQKVLELQTPKPENLQLTLNGTSYQLPRPRADGSWRIEAP